MKNKITKKLVTSSSQQRLTPYWCSSCVELVTMISVEEAAAIYQTEIEVLICQIEKQRVHTLTSSAKVQFICFPSLRKRMSKGVKNTRERQALAPFR